MANSAANSPADKAVDFQGATRGADGYQYWTTSLEDEEAVDQVKAPAPAAEAAAASKKKRKPRRPGAAKRLFLRLFIFGLLAAIIAAGYLIFTITQVQSAADEVSIEPADAIVVLGAAQYNGSPSYVLQERLDHAYNLWREGTAPLIMTTGAGQEGDITTEGLVGLEHLLAKGVPEEAIIVIPEGVNTWEQLSASAYQMELRKLESVLLVSDRYHNYRLLDIADELGMQANVSPSAVEATTGNFLRESVAVAIGRVTGYRRLSSFTTDG